MIPDIDQIFLDIINGNTEATVYDEVDNAKGEYVWDWEDDFDDLEEAYAEQGRGGAECLILNNLIKQYGASQLDVDDHSILFDRLADHYQLHTN